MTVSTITFPSEKELSVLLSQPQFSTAQFLNQTLGNTLRTNTDHDTNHDNNHDTNHDDEEDMLSTKLAELALQLQVQTQSCHDSISKIGAELRAVLPRCAADVGRLTVGLDGMKEDASSLLESHLSTSLARSHRVDETTTLESPEEQTDTADNGEVDKENSSPPSPPPTSSSQTMNNGMTPLETLETLSTLHALQQNLSHTKEILTAASNWDATMSSLPTHLQSSSTLPAAVASLTKLEQGARALVGMPGHESRMDDLHKVRSNIQTLLKPQLTHALQRMETRLGPLTSIVEFYSALGKMDSLMEEYVKSRPKSLHSLWFEFGKSYYSNTNNRGGAGAGGAGRKSHPDDLEFYSDNEDEESDQEDNNNNNNNNAGQEHNNNAQITSGEAFGTWLSTWYEAVVSLLTEERRRALQVFGPELACEILAQVLEECFRPILSSFATRLSAIYPLDEEDIGMMGRGGGGSLESICAAYNATLQFLSVAFEQMAELQSAASNSSTTASASSPSINQSKGTTSARTREMSLYGLIRSMFTSIASPFRPYQLKYGSLEKIHSKQTAQVVAKDVHASVGASKMSLATLQDSVERLSGLAPFMFPLAQCKFLIVHC
jgi:hypothetical protein